jgi:uncharacterized surface protein with fasciclin (FAS1) repeats
MKTRRTIRSGLTAAGLLLISDCSPAGSLAEEYAACNAVALAPFEGTIVDAAAATPELSTLLGLVANANLTDALSGPGPLTVYAPTNSAFASVPSSVLNALAEDPALLTAVLTYHVSPGTVDPRKFKTARERRTLLPKQSVFIDFDLNGPKVNQSKANCQGVQTRNGTVWLIDSVLIPQFLP